ncbi:ATP-grasp domain-containing protein [Thioalkalivibrio thiocyanodenitrificans]|uniref:hypothetical protein n=1 Tax=Thioalkalivibrio thiocyanodenitrificans TaxID=243063 RepID=UPI000A010B55|nr:hypothetical protein [Thioalkalivibrio thiocyanodenitrificans]
MIFYVCVARHARTLAALVTHYRPDLRRCLRVVPYSRMDLLLSVGSGIVIWTDLDRLDRSVRARACAMHDVLVERGISTLNHPTASLTRFPLLQALAAEGRNPFRVFRPDACPSDLRFPVFLRRESGFMGSCPELLADASALHTALEALRRSGADRDDWMVVEYSAEPGPDGYFRKYGAFRIGSDIFPQHCFINRHWFVKHAYDRLGEAHRREHLQYVTENPHVNWIREIFDRAGITYGRIDYGETRGRLQVFEINTNPTVLNHPQTRFDPDLQPYADRYADTLIALANRHLAGSGPDIVPMIDRVNRLIMLRLHVSSRRSRLRRFLRGWCGGLRRAER